MVDEPSRRDILKAAPAAALVVSSIAPLAGCDTPPTGPQSVEQIHFTEEHAKWIRDDVAKRLRLTPPINENEMTRLLFSIQNEGAPKVLDMNGSLMRVYMEFYANNIPDMLKQYGVRTMSNAALVKKRIALYNTINFKVAFLRYCSEHSRRNPLLAVPLGQLYAFQSDAKMVVPTMPTEKMPDVATARANWIDTVKTMPQEKIEPLANLVSIQGGFEVGTQTSFVLETPRISVSPPSAPK